MLVQWKLNPLINRYLNIRVFTTFLTYLFITLGFSYLAVRSNQVKRKLFTLFGKSYFNGNYPKIINNAEDCIDAVKELRKVCAKTRVLGMDCEWRSDNRSAYSRVALLQLASIDGYCSLFRLCNMGHVPDCLSELLSDNSILKVGVAVTNDARKLLKDFGVQCFGCVDIRYMAKHVGLTALGLGKMSHLYLRVELDKSWKTRCSNWEAEVLSEKQIDYAAQDAIASVQLYGYFNKKYINETYPWWKRWFNTGKSIDDDTNSFWFKYADIGFSEKSYSWHDNANDISLKKQKLLSRNSTSDPRNLKNYSTWLQTARKSPLYHNIFIQAPDGMVLCTCDQKKADWYLNKGIAKVVGENPLTLRLTFEPSGRKGGGEGYYAKIKNNQCVVCGGTKLMRRKNIVPHEYRKYFPVEIKGHSSHDVLLLCNFCHSKTQFFDQQLRLQLANECNAPLGNCAGNVRLLNIPELRQVKSAARALLINGPLIPEARRKELNSVLLSYLDQERTFNNESKLADDGDDDDFDDTVIINIDSSEILDTSTLERLSNVTIRVENEEYRPHGLRVVEHYKNKCENSLDGVYLLEQTWRNHFLSSMAPKYLPELWSVNYSHNNRE